MSLSSSVALSPEVIFSYSSYSIGPDLICANNGTGTSATWPAANRAIFIPFYLSTGSTATKISWMNGGAVSGNCDAGIYDFSGKLMISSGSTAQAGASSIQTVDITDTYLSPGTYYMALAINNTTATTTRHSMSTPVLRSMGIAQQDTAFVLPSTATLANPAATYIPNMAVSFRAVTGSP